MDASALLASIDNPVPTSNWTVSKLQVLEIMLMAKADLATVKTCYESCPEAPTERLLANVIKHGAKPGVIGFLAAKQPELVDEILQETEKRATISEVNAEAKNLKSSSKLPLLRVPVLPIYTVLNWLGRQKACSSETTKAEFMDLLAKVQNDTVLFREDVCQNPATPEDRFDILYALLRENPDRWSSNNSQGSLKMTRSGNKRKHSAIS